MSARLLLWVLAAACGLAAGIVWKTGSAKKQNTVLRWERGGEKKLRRTMAEIRKNGRQGMYCLMCFSLGNREQLSLYGEDSEQRLMEELTRLLQESCRLTDLLVSIGKEELILLRLCPELDFAKQWAASQCTRFHQSAAQKRLIVGDAAVHAGVLQLDEDGEESSPEYQLSHVRIACREACKTGTAVIVSNKKMRKKTESDRASLQELHRAMDKREFVYYVQPYVDAVTGQPVGGEALVRWEHPTRGLIMPGQFIEIIEQVGMIPELDFYCLDFVCRKMQELKMKDLSCSISCNVSRDTLSKPDFLGRFQAIVGKYDFDRSKLIVEITESALIRQETLALSAVQGIHALGIQVALDDFGSGYTSVADLTAYEINYLKLDMSILRGAVTEQGRRLLNGLIQFGRCMGCTVLCEGAESREQADMLRQMGCDRIQGYYFYRPMPFERVVEMLEFQKNQKR